MDAELVLLVLALLMAGGATVVIYKTLTHDKDES